MLEETRHYIVDKLREGLSHNINKIYIFDFDGTLIATPTPEEGKLIYKEKTGIDWPHIGWWSKKESLDCDIFDIQPIKSVLNEYRKVKGDMNILKVLMTGRIPKLRNEVEFILEKHGLFFDVYEYCDSSSTLNFKLNKIDGLVRNYTKTNEIVIFEDRIEHAEEFGKLDDYLENINVSVVLVK